MVRIVDFVSAWWNSMLAPPGYAKMASTPSRSRQAMTISLPFMAGATSGRLRAGGFLMASMVLLMLFALVVAGIAAWYEKTHDRCQPWVFVEIQISFDKSRRHRRLR